MLPTCVVHDVAGGHNKAGRSISLTDTNKSSSRTRSAGPIFTRRFGMPVADLFFPLPLAYSQYFPAA